MLASPADYVLLGLDSFAVCLALGPLGFASRRVVARLIMSFGLYDGLALLLGGVFHMSQFWSVAVVPVLIVLWLALVLLLMMSGARLLPLLPVLLSADNLLTGIASGRAVTLYEAVAAGFVSAVFAAAGLIAGNALAPHLRHRGLARIAGASWLVAIGFVAIGG
jgi:hypothetical protein